MQSPISRRRFLERSTQLAMTAGAAGSLLAACGGSTAASGSTNTTITFWNAYNVTDPENQTLLNKVIPAFHKKYPNITIKSQNIPYNSLLQKLIATASGGAGPDVVRTDIIWMPQLAKIGALVPTDDIVAQRKSDFYPGPLATCAYKGKYYGLPLDTNTRVVFYNKTLLSQAGFNQAPTTTAEFQTMAAKVTALNKSFYGYAEGGLDPWNILPWIWSFGGSVTNDDYTKASGYINSQQSVAALEYLVKLYNSHTLAPNLLGGSSYSPDDEFGKGHVGFILEGPWVPPTMKQTYASLQYDMVPMPTGPDGSSSSVVGGEDIAVMSSSKNIDAAKTFMQFMTSEDAQVLMGEVGQMPVLTKLTDDSRMPAYFSMFAKQLQTAKPRPVTPNYTKIETILTDAFNRVFRGQASAQAALDSAAQQIDPLLS
ncbi:extracellular solute-binding protein [Dictyobacter aurantiacus]|uniref:ABC transporter substrate-binding protein n=1 Tax=Dictyobacter aurantiacus TaxID=1936993 RepID=A0A401ZGD8_9CHLR|nr:extracellular solute-binding protein [Dictyobacter aurantiacus]GCE05954.1 ABC transporter substrate-binding protein [Dictyobacter aurantiacus]